MLWQEKMVGRDLCERRPHIQRMINTVLAGIYTPLEAQQRFGVSEERYSLVMAHTERNLLLDAPQEDRVIYRALRSLSGDHGLPERFW